MGIRAILIGQNPAIEQTVIASGEGSEHAVSGAAVQAKLNPIVQTITGLQKKVKTGSISLTTTWSGSDPYTQAVTITGANSASKVDLQLTAAQLQQCIDDGVLGLYVENNNGVFTVYALGAAPTQAMTVQCTLTEIG